MQNCSKVECTDYGLCIAGQVLRCSKRTVKGNIRDVDEYNRRYDSRDNDFVMENDTLYINEKEMTAWTANG